MSELVIVGRVSNVAVSMPAAPAMLTIAQPGVSGPKGRDGAAGVLVGTTITGDVDGVNTEFTLGEDPVAVIIMLNGLAQKEGADFTRTGAVVTFIDAPHAGDTVQAMYFYNQ